MPQRVSDMLGHADDEQSDVETAAAAAAAAADTSCFREVSDARLARLQSLRAASTICRSMARRPPPLVVAVAVGDAPPPPSPLKHQGAGDGDAPDMLDREYWRDRPRRWWLLARWWPGARLPELLACVTVGLVLTLAVPCPEGLPLPAWRLFGVFIATIVGLVLQPLPIAGVCAASTAVCIWSGLLTHAEAFAGFAEPVVCLIVTALLMAQAVDKSGIGARVSLLCIAAVGGTPLGLTYALMAADVVLALGVPSTTAREGGIFLPVIRGISASFASYPDDRASSRRLGGFLMMAQLQHTQPTSAMWLTGAAPNALALGLAQQQGVVLPAGEWATWAAGAVLPAIAIMAVTPPLVLWMYPPTLRRTPAAAAEARRALRALGRLSYAEAATLAVLLFALAFWVAGGYVKPTPISSAAVALMALVLMLAAGTLEWCDCLACGAAWNTFWWLGLLMGQAGALSKRGVYTWLADAIAAPLEAAHMPVVCCWMLLLVLYVACHYAFASQSAHVAALYAPFLAVLLRMRVSPVLSALSLAYVGNALTGMNHYASAEAVLYHSQRYFSVAAVWAVGAVMTAVNLVGWLGLGLGWWRALGWYTDIGTMS